MNNFFDFQELKLNYGYCYRIRFDDFQEIISYSDLKYGFEKELYENEMRLIVEIMIRICALVNDRPGIVARYNEKWIIDKDKSRFLWKRMVEQKISNNFKGGFIITNQLFIEKLTQEILEYNCFALFIYEKIVIAPSDHMDIYVWFLDIALKNKFEFILKKHANGKMLLELIEEK